MKQISLDKYASILHKAYVKSHRHPHMSLDMRAGQFAPFAALAGHQEAINKVCQYLEEQQRPAEYELEILKRQLDHLQEIINQRPLITICFVDKNAPAKPLQLTARVKRIDEYTRHIIMEDGRQVPFTAILTIELQQ